MVDCDGRRKRGLEAVLAALERAERPVLTTHVNADGDGAGSEVAVAGHLARRGRRAVIVNPTPFPELYEFLLGDLPAYHVDEPHGREALERTDLVLVLDTSEASRLGAMGSRLEGHRVACIDHHPPNPDPLGDPAVLDPAACATGELVYDLLRLAGGDLSLLEARALYVAISTDTGSFRFSNTTPRTHRIAAHLLEAGVDPEEIYRRLHAQLTPERIRLIRAALEALEVDAELPIAWVTLPRVALEGAGAAREDMEGIVEYPRRLRGIEVAILFHELPGGRTKASLRSNGAVDVAAVARSLGGGGHPKAAGVLLDLPLAAGTQRILESVREAVRSEIGRHA